MSRVLLVEGRKTFRITVPDEAKLTFGPWSPPSEAKNRTYDNDKSLNGTLRVYETAKTGASILAVFSGVTSYRELSLEYDEMVMVEKGSTVWQSDKKGYSREESVSRQNEWVDPAKALLTSGSEIEGDL